MKVNHKSKGITLVETMVSLAIIMILIIPVSSLVMGTLNTNKKAESKQEATLIGQQITEEVKSMKDIYIEDKGGEKYIQLLKGNFKLTKTEEGKQIFTKDRYADSKFNVELMFKKNLMQDNFQVNKDDRVNFEITFKNNKLVINHNDKKVLELLTKPEKLSIEIIQKDSKKEVVFYDGDKKNNIRKFAVDIDEKSKLDFKVTEEVKGNLNMDIYNTCDDAIKIYISKDENFTGNINVNTVIGSVKKYDEVFTDFNEGSQIGDLYDVNIKVYKNQEAIFNNDFKHNMCLK